MAFRWWVSVASRIPTALASSRWLPGCWLLSEMSTSQTGRDPPASASASSNARLTDLAVRVNWRPIGGRAGGGMGPDYPKATKPSISNGRWTGQTEGMHERVIAVVGPTAAGKSDLALGLALALGGEIVNADSMQLYAGMDIGTAKLTVEQRRGVPHHLLDIWDVRHTAA